MRTSAFTLFVAIALVANYAPAAPRSTPSHPPFRDCAWEELADAAVGLAAWVQRCDYSFRKIDFLFVGQALAMRFSDSGTPDPVVEVIDRLPGETPEAGGEHPFPEDTGKAGAARC